MKNLIMNQLMKRIMKKYLIIITGELAAGDVIEFYNVGGYSIVDKPPFIHPDIPIYMKSKGQISCVKRAQTLDDIFAPYMFD